MSVLGLSCIFPVPDIHRTSNYYVNCLGFRAAYYLNCKEPHVCLYLDRIEIILLRSNTDNIRSNRDMYGYGYDAYLYTDEPESLEKKFSDKGVKIIKHLEVTDYGNREFVIEDIDGRLLAFGVKTLLNEGS